ncbi:MAG TPA: RHS repeat-associated core domain-containing protein [Pyrinomonadaceae bacterium]|nr:RHS repeat-associated core domain-containing protein [Pyrinomonadaceae bacterium]
MKDYVYDAENKQTSYQESGVDKGSYYYDGDGRRVKRVANGVTTIYVYDIMGQLIAEYGGEPINSGTRYLTQDHLGSTRVVTDSAGNVKERHDYLPFGEEMEARVSGRGDVGQQEYKVGDTRQKFTNYERDTETNLDYAINRYYSSTQGRFSSPDPYNIILEKEKGENAGDKLQILLVYISQPQIWNKYSYSLNNPLTISDPDGRRPLTNEERNNIQKFIQSGIDYANNEISDAKEREQFINEVRMAASVIENAIAAVPDNAKEDPKNLRAVLYAIGKIGEPGWDTSGSKYINSNGYKVTLGTGTNKCNLFVAAAYALGANIGFQSSQNPGGYQVNST